MIKKILKWTGIVLGVVVLGLAGTYLYISSNVDGRIAKRYAFGGDAIKIPTDTAALARGKHLVAIKGCNKCHGEDLGGKMMADDAMLGTLSASNLTYGKGGLPPEFDADAWVQALRHGIDHTGRPLVIMPSTELAMLTRDDIADIVAYAQSVPKVDREMPAVRVGPLAKVLTYFDVLPLLAVETIRHDEPVTVDIDTAMGPSYGHYLAIGCQACHRPNMKGGDGLGPDMPPVPDISSTGRVGTWTHEQFRTVLKTGKTPDGRQIDPEHMPWKMTMHMNEKEIGSLYAYLKGA